MKRPFAVLDSLEDNKAKIAETLISTTVNNELVLIIIKTKPSTIESLRKSQIQIAKCKSSIIYAVTDLQSTKMGIDILLRMKWHKPVLHMIIGKKGLEEKISNSCKTGNEDIDFIERELGSDILCYIDPLDDQLEFYAEGFMRKIITDAFPSLLS